MSLWAGALWRVDAYLTAFNAGDGWEYMPSFGEIMVTVGMAAAGMAVFILVSRLFPVVTLRDSHSKPTSARATSAPRPVDKSLLHEHADHHRPRYPHRGSPPHRPRGQWRQGQNAWSSGTMWRGIETILQGRDPREAWFRAAHLRRCTTVHAMASVRAVENAIGLEIPMNAQYIRNLILTAHASTTTSCTSITCPRSTGST